MEAKKPDLDNDYKFAWLFVIGFSYAVLPFALLLSKLVIR